MSEDNSKNLSYPNSIDLPLILDCIDWKWKRFYQRSEFWVGTDENNLDWLVKMRGGFYAFRERAFSIIAQSLDISCQSSTFIQLDKNQTQFSSGRSSDTVQGATLLYQEHTSPPCKPDCPLTELNNRIEKAQDKVLLLLNTKIDRIIDLVRGDFLGYLCNMHEPPGYLFTRNHRFIQIDNEQMFTIGEANVFDSFWLKTKDETYSESGLEVLRILCKSIIELDEKVLNSAIEIPQTLKIDMPWDVQTIINNLKPKASMILESDIFNL